MTFLGDSYLADPWGEDFEEDTSTDWALTRGGRTPHAFKAQNPARTGANQPHAVVTRLPVRTGANQPHAVVTHIPRRMQ